MSPRIFGSGPRRFPLPPIAWRTAEPPPPPARRSAALELVAEGESFEDTPLGGYAGEMIVASGPTPPAPEPLQQLVIEPPPWQDALDRGELDLAALTPPAAPGSGLSAIDTMRLDDDGYDPEPGGPPARPLQPLLPVSIPPPDWRQEELERAEREAAEKERVARERRDEVLRELLAEDTSAYPKGKT